MIEKRWIQNENGYENILYYSSNLDSPREEVILEPGDYVFRIQQGNNENASYIFVIELSKKSKY